MPAKLCVLQEATKNAQEFPLYAIMLPEKTVFPLTMSLPSHMSSRDGNRDVSFEISFGKLNT